MDFEIFRSCTLRSLPHYTLFGLTLRSVRTQRDFTVPPLWTLYRRLNNVLFAQGQ